MTPVNPQKGIFKTNLTAWLKNKFMTMIETLNDTHSIKVQ